MKAVILAGGTGTRLWPLSRRSAPKQFQKLASERTLFQEAVDRLQFLNPEDIYVATNIDFMEIVKEQAPHIPQENLILEPALRDTASCIGWAAAVIEKKHPEEVMAVLYADHLIQDREEFEHKLKIAEKVAREQKTLNIIEVTAKFPNVNLGYVKIDDEIEKIDNVAIHGFEQFTEKPDLETAKKFLEDGNYLWNTGIYVWRVDTILEAYKNHLPDSYERFTKMQNALNTPEEKNIINTEYPQLEKISVDYAIMEKVAPSQVRILPADLGWSDIGTWLSLHDELAPSAAQNLTQGDVLPIDTTGSVIYNTDADKKVVVLGLDGMAVINTPDAILICPKNRSQDVKKVIEALKAEKSKLI